MTTPETAPETPEPSTSKPGASAPTKPAPGSRPPPGEGAPKLRAPLIVGLGLLVVAGIAFLLQRPPGQAGPSRAVVGAHSAAEPTSELTSLGPLHTGDLIGEGWKIDHIDAMTSEVQITLSRSGKSWTLGLTALKDQKDTPIVSFPDIYVWYAGQSGPDPELAAMIQALIQKLRDASEGRPLFERVMEWGSHP